MASFSTDQLTDIVFNNDAVTEVYYNGTEVWSKLTSVTISGSASVGGTLTANIASGDASPMEYQWLRNGVAISGANAQTYTLTSADSGSAISVQVTAWGGRTVTSAAVSVQTLLFSIDGTALSQWTSAGFSLISSRSPTISNGYTRFQSVNAQSASGTCGYSKSSTTVYNTFTLEFTAYCTQGTLNNSRAAFSCAEGFRCGAFLNNGNATVQGLSLISGINASNPLKLRVEYDGTDVYIYNNGVLLGTVPKGNMPSDTTKQFMFGCVNGYDACDLYVKDVRFYYS